MDTPSPQDMTGPSSDFPQDNSPPPIAVQSAPLPAPLAPIYRDRSIGLVVFGIGQIVLAGFALLAIPLMLLSAVLARKAGSGMPLGNYLVSCATYGLMAILLGTLGMGSIRARRWAWALTLITSWVWLVTGVLTTVLLTAMLPTTFLVAMRAGAANNPGAAQISAGVMAGILTFFIAVGAVFLVVLPIIFLVFYRSKDTEETCKHRDPLERWTDRRPLPILAASLLFAWSSVHYAGMSFAIPLFPWFGKYVTGLPAGICLFLCAALSVFLAYSLLRVQLVGWWIAIASLTLQLVSTVITVRRADLLQAYSKIGWSQVQLQVMSANPGMRSGVYMYWGLGFSVIFLGYMIWIKRYFVVPASSSLGSEPSLPVPVV